MQIDDLGQSVKIYPTTWCKFLSLLKMGVPVFADASRVQLFLNYTELFCGNVDWLAY